MSQSTQKESFQPIERFDYAASRKAVEEKIRAARRGVARPSEPETDTCRDYPVYGCERCDV